MARYHPIKKRRRLALTDYQKRVALLKSDAPRLVIRKSNRSILAQIIAFEPAGDKVLTGVNSNVLRKFEWAPRSNTPTAYLTGLALARRAKKLNLESIVLDIGLYKPGKNSVVFAAAKGAVDGGLNVLNGIQVDEKRLSGAHIESYAKENADAFKGYAADKFDAKKLTELFENTKKKIIASNE